MTDRPVTPHGGREPSVLLTDLEEAQRYQAAIERLRPFWRSHVKLTLAPALPWPDRS